MLKGIRLAFRSMALPAWGSVAAQRNIMALILVRTLCSGRKSGLQCQETTSCLEGQVLLHPLVSLQLADLFWPLLLSFQKVSICTCISANTDMTEEHQIHQTEAASFVVLIIYLFFLTHENWDIILNLVLIEEGYHSISAEDLGL